MSRFIQAARLTLGNEGQRLNVLGDSQRVILTGEDTGGLYALIENFNPPGMSIPLHLHHNEDETFNVLEGVSFGLGWKQLQQIRGRPFTCRATCRMRLPLLAIDLPKC
ncbi:hypothetical protein HJG54_24145 [Leptolyngbya sp. NK1-12]|uniref:Cupin domain-containing protein n=1 Tax=Leptolyngbya sp. NK1-12 TaxID=2547451 RepID=A0AA97ARP0_9CYAN|nr:hypothetical protein [Leptolyngbya sp. NK1-12]WNZ25623.1 hypothetical protein HJG54_24145 [Leptolyngbya sp. NK1-12]